MKWWKNECIQSLRRVLLTLGVVVGIINCTTFQTYEPYEITDETLLAKIPDSFSTPRDARNWVIRQVDYEEDDENRWQLPEKTLAEGKGDCEDYALAVAYVIVTRVDRGEDAPPVFLVSAVGHMWIVIDDLLLDSVSHFTWIKAAKSPGTVYTYEEAIEKARSHERAFD